MKSYLSCKLCYLFIGICFLSTSCSKAIGEKQAPDSSPIIDPAKMNVHVFTIAGKADDRGHAEDGNGAAARFWNPTKMIFDSRNNMLYVADGTTIRSIDEQNNVKTYMPVGTTGGFNEILDMDIAPGTAGGTLYFTSHENDLWKIEPNGNSFTTTKIVDRVYGGNTTGALNTADHFDGTNGIATSPDGTIYFFNTYWNTMRRITLTAALPVAGTVNPFAGKPLTSRSGSAWPFKDGQGEEATFSGYVADITSDGNGNIYVADFKNDLVRMVTPGGRVTSLFQYKDGWGIDKDGPVTTAQANRVTQVSATRNGSSVFFTTYGKGGYNLPALRLLRPGKDVTTLVGDSKVYGDGTGKDAGFGTIGGIATTPDGKTIYVSEPGKKVIRKVAIQ